LEKNSKQGINGRKGKEKKELKEKNEEGVLVHATFATHL